MTLVISEIKPPNGILKSLYMCFTDNTKPSLVIAKINRIEVHDVTPEGLQLAHTLPVYGKISTIASFQPPLCLKHWLIVVTESDKLYIVAYSGRFVVMEDVQFSSTGSQSSIDTSSLVAVDPRGEFIVIHSFQGYVQTIPVNLRYPKRFQEATKKAQYERLFQSTVVSSIGGVMVQKMCLVRSGDKSMLAIAARDANLKHFFRYYGMSGHRFSLLYQSPNLTNEVTALAPLTRGVLCLTSYEQFIFPFPEETLASSDKTVADKGGVLVRQLSEPMELLTATIIDERIICGSADGQICILHIHTEESTLKSWSSTDLGKATVANDLIHLNNGIFFAPSQLSRSVIFQVRPSAPHIDILQFVASSPPILNVEVQNDNTCLTLDICQGGYNSGEVARIQSRVVTKTVLGRFKGVGPCARAWSFPRADGRLIVMKQIDGWRCLELLEKEANYELREASLQDPMFGGLTGKETVLDVSMVDGRLVIVTDKIDGATAFFGCLVGDKMVYVTQNAIKVTDRTIHEISASSISAFHACLNDGELVVAVGLWDNAVLVITEKSSFTVNYLPFNGAITSVLLKEFHGVVSLVVGDGNGNLYLVPDIDSPAMVAAPYLLGPFRVFDLNEKFCVVTQSGTLVFSYDPETLTGRNLGVSDVVLPLTDGVILSFHDQSLEIIRMLESTANTIRTLFLPADLVRKKLALREMFVLLTQREGSTRLKLIRDSDFKVLDTFTFTDGVEGTDICSAEYQTVPSQVSELDHPMFPELLGLLATGFMVATNYSNTVLSFFAVKNDKIVKLCSSEVLKTGPGHSEAVLVNSVLNFRNLFLVCGNVTVGFQLVYDSDQDAFALIRVTDNTPTHHFSLTMKAWGLEIYLATVLNSVYSLKLTQDFSKTASLKKRHSHLNPVGLKYYGMDLQKVAVPHQNFLTALEVLPRALITSDATGNVIILDRNTWETLAMVNLGDQVNTLSGIRGFTPSRDNPGMVPVAIACTVNGGVYLLQQTEVTDYDTVMEGVLDMVARKQTMESNPREAYIDYRGILLRNGTKTEPFNFLEVELLREAKTERCDEILATSYSL
ncbi:hypothetical protein BABINDRAFT_114365 [Babjeviella inositovora NRRL Y-12698]|uniref:RSE1/DDB1/CPSF1 first beta-propeller domain-containing protein n=1 Tax=Babjeviella inositovora NRRL Y-12698 TaxID=984486 RepID=A0A1E3QWG5_9ASCO|nr:uncharacterized protein BABINDRAFT_114365 [Babjeviella inositovora NRRL Y-12698]ODQ82015.1 hypothetical protein BABINDRAFT_114365 [Babjeviella inositovora NRRL Y-12698]